MLENSDKGNGPFVGRLACPRAIVVYIQKMDGNKDSFAGGSMAIRSTYSFLFLFLLMPGAPADSAGLDDADERLFKVQLAMAEKGDSRAQYYLGEMHEQGLGTRQNIDEAFKWYAKAAEQGDSLAKRKLAHRQEIIREIKKEQIKPAGTAAMSTQSAVTTNRSAPAAVTQSDRSRQQDWDGIKEAEREKKRAMVRAMILERMRHPVGAPFGE